MNEARFWIGAADKLAAAGNESMANQASEQANFFLGQAEGSLGDDCLGAGSRPVAIVGSSAGAPNALVSWRLGALGRVIVP